MNSGSVEALIRALSSAVSRLSEYADPWDEEFNRGARLIVLEAVLSTLHGRYPIEDTVNGVWNLSGLDPASFEVARRLFRTEFEVSLKPASHSFTLDAAAAVLDGVSIDLGRQHRHRSAGAFFTPPALASFLAAEVLHTDAGWSVLEEQRIIDPACGAGSLLLGILAEGKKRLDAAHIPHKRGRLTEWATRNIVGIDRNQDVAIIAASLLGLALGVRIEEVLDARMIRVADSLLDNTLEVNSYDVVIMNPPWIRMKDLGAADYSARLRVDSRYPLTTRDGRGDLDLYQFFLERAFSLATEQARIGFIVPGSFLRSSRAARLRHLYLTAGHLIRLDEFWNTERLFPIHSMFRFVTGVFEKGATSLATDARFRVESIEDVIEQHPKRLPPDLFVEAANGTAKPIPEVTSRSGLALIRKISARQPALGSPKNPWDGLFRFRREFDMTGDRHRFVESAQVDWRTVTCGWLRPVYEGRMVHQFDSAAKTYRSGTGRSAEWIIWLPGRQFRSQFYLDESNIPPELVGHINRPRAGFCDVSGHANERTILAAVIPSGAVCGNKVPTLEIGDYRLHHLWVAIANSFVVDWYLRRSVTTTINYHYLLGTPFPWVAPTSSVGRSLVALTQLLTAPRSSDPGDLWRRAQARADIDCQVAMLFDLDATELNDILDDFPLLDRGQPSADGGPSTITRDLVVARHARMLGQTNPEAEARVREARSVCALPYVPGELAAELTAGTNGARMRHSKSGIPPAP